MSCHGSQADRGLSLRKGWRGETWRNAPSVKKRHSNTDNRQTLRTLCTVSRATAHRLTFIHSYIHTLTCHSASQTPRAYCSTSTCGRTCLSKNAGGVGRLDRLCLFFVRLLLFPLLQACRLAIVTGKTAPPALFPPFLRNIISLICALLIVCIHFCSNPVVVSHWHSPNPEGSQGPRTVTKAEPCVQRHWTFVLLWVGGSLFSSSARSSKSTLDLFPHVLAASQSLE